MVQNGMAYCMERQKYYLHLTNAMAPVTVVITYQSGRDKASKAWTDNDYKPFFPGRGGRGRRECFSAATICGYQLWLYKCGKASCISCQVNCMCAKCETTELVKRTPATECSINARSSAKVWSVPKASRRWDTVVLERFNKHVWMKIFQTSCAHKLQKPFNGIFLLTLQEWICLECCRSPRALKRNRTDQFRTTVAVFTPTSQLIHLLWKLFYMRSIGWLNTTSKDSLEKSECFDLDAIIRSRLATKTLA